MSRKLRRALALPMRETLLLAEALLRSVSAWIMIRATPYSWWRGALGTPAALAVSTDSASASAPMALEVARVHARIAGRFRGRFTCLMLALSARGMLASRGVPSLLVLGVKLRDRGKPSANPMAAHAWVVCGDEIVVGGKEREGHTPVAAYVRNGVAQAGGES